MRTIALLICALLFAPSIVAQEHLSHQLIVDLSLEICDGQGAAGSITGYRTVPSGARFSISGSTSDHFIIRFWEWTSDEEVAFQKTVTLPDSDFVPARLLERSESSTNKFRRDLKTGTDLFFKMRKGDLSTYAVPLYSVLSPVLGASVLPFKLRPQTGEFTKDLTLSGMGGIRFRPWRKDSFSVGALFGVGVTSVSLDSTNTEGKVLEPSDRAAITLSTGLVMQWERLQIGVFMGWDHLNKADRKLWVHQGAPWLALGIGVSIFSEDSEVNNETNK